MLNLSVGTQLVLYVRGTVVCYSRGRFHASQQMLETRVEFICVCVYRL
jgi:hypothetical protein